MLSKKACLSIRTLGLVYIVCAGIYFAYLRWYRPTLHLTREPAPQPDSYTHVAPNTPFKFKVELPTATNTTERVKAGFFVLVPNRELPEMLQSMYDVEKRFNHKFNYPWIFLNDEPFTDEFIQATSAMTNAKVSYGQLNDTMWGYPSWIDKDKAARVREEARNAIPYGGSESYRLMCRFQSGFFFRHPLIIEADWEFYWRVEPGVRYYCDLDYDPFLYMKQNNKKYAFNIAFIEHGGTIPTLWSEIRNFAKISFEQGKDYFNNLLGESMYRVVTENGENYNQCHFWTNFEIARIDLWQSEAFLALFEHLDRAGGYFYERWGDAPVRSIFASLFLKKDELHFFNDIGYKHSIYEHCPAEPSLLRRCTCDPEKSLDYKDQMSCLSNYMTALGSTPPRGKKTVGELLRS